MWPVCSTLQRRRERQRAAGQVVQPLLAVPGRLPAVAALPGHVGVRQAVVEMRGAADGGLRRSHDAAAHRGRVVRRSQRAGARRGEPAARCVASAIGCPADSPAGASQELEPLRVVLSGLEGRRKRQEIPSRRVRFRRSSIGAENEEKVLSSSLLRFSRDLAVPIIS